MYVDASKKHMIRGYFLLSDSEPYDEGLLVKEHVDEIRKAWTEPFGS